MKNGFVAARRLHARARSELTAAVTVGDRDGIRQAAEKGWLSVVEATKALLRHRGAVAPGGTGRQRDALLRLGQADRRARKLRVVFSACRESLHIACFYDDEVNVPLVEAALGDASAFIELAARLG